MIIEGSVTGGVTMNSEKFNDQFYDFDEAASIAPSDVDIRKYYKGVHRICFVGFVHVDTFMQIISSISFIERCSLRTASII